ncbi:MAG: hypothetical protein AUJ28_01030 [Parcubacteria group bacterium CG1_02_37_51]|uniref:DDH domain-containing protein n=2 Tax=Candidatus Komeiliibacteriota TaxID=1817908 RepID=A0A2M7RF93_9BACT|nr:MAG: hypothetical protein AUJ28_01030 [Parcubacteria group bacterium CG1_02_37_51]PIY95425.1 MAG: hypothetical protein COY67_00050 [Candidatus Komeilibacteria bacterium CG_4_10_14_0_8_um_filter_37_78]
MLSQKQQINNRLQQAKNILLISKAAYHGDDVSALLAWYKFLLSLHKSCDVIIDNFSLRPEYKFLPGWQNIKKQINKLKKFTLSVNIAQTKLEDFSYDITGDELLLYLTPQKGFFEAKDVQIKDIDFKYDLIICLGVQDYDALGSIYNEHADFFLQTPVINIDNHQLNEHFGEINEVDITKTSIAEMSYDLFNFINKDLIDQEIATCLLTGLIQATKSFKTTNVNSQTLQVASELIKLGGNRKEIVDRLFNTKSIPILKLWGKILTRLQVESKYSIVWSYLDRDDVLNSGAEEKDLIGSIDELIMTSPQAEIVVIFYTAGHNQTRVYLYSTRNFDSLRLLDKYNPTGNKDLAFCQINQPVEEVTSHVIEHLKNKVSFLLP